MPAEQQQRWGRTATPLPWSHAMHPVLLDDLAAQTGLITEEVGLDDGVTVLQQLGLIPQS